MKELKIEHITNSHGDTFQITDSDGATVRLSPDEAVLILQFLYERADELTRLVNGLEVREPLLQECKYCGQYHESHLIEQCPMKRLA